MEEKMSKQAEYNEEGELLYEYSDYWNDGPSYGCGDSYCPGNCGRCA
jgi:hypothetical protein